MALLRRAVHRAKDLVFIAPFDRLWRRDMLGKITCLLYHRIDEHDRAAFLTAGGLPFTPRHAFEREMQFLLGIGARFYTFDDLRRGAFPSRSELGVIVSFDDCFADNYTVGLGVLESLSIRGVFFQTAGLVDATELLWEHALYWHTRDDSAARRFTMAVRRDLADVAGTRELEGRALAAFLRETVASDRVDAMLRRIAPELDSHGTMSAIARGIYPTCEQIRAAASRGHEIGCHGYAHYKRATISDTVFMHDLERARGALRDVTATPLAFSYPFNSYRPDDASICGRLFAQAATVDKRRIEHSTDPLWLPRFTSPGEPRNSMRRRRWLFRGEI